MWGQRENQVNVYCFGFPKKGTECCWSHGAQAESTIARTPCILNCVFGRFYLRLSRIKQSQVIAMVIDMQYSLCTLVEFVFMPCYVIIVIIFQQYVQWLIEWFPDTDN